MIVCLGHSHVRAVSDAARRDRARVTALNLWKIPRGAVDEGDAVRFRADIEGWLRRQSGPVFSLLGGSAHNVVGMLAHPRRFDFVLPSRPEMPLLPDAECVPSGAVRALLERESALYLRQMRRLRTLCGDRVCQLEAPPPSLQIDCLAREILWKHLVERNQNFEREISPAPLRWKLWRLQAELLRGWCDRNGVDYLASPPEALDADGFLRPELDGDGLHANEAYGRMLLRQMGSR